VTRISFPVAVTEVEVEAGVSVSDIDIAFRYMVVRLG
jgi:hypothetical protein